MKNSKSYLFFLYGFPLILFGLSTYRLFRLYPEDLLVSSVERSEVIGFWVTLAWLLVTLSPWLVRRVVELRFSISSIASIRREGLLLLLIVLLGFYLRAFVAPWTHRLFDDEDIYLNIGRNIQAQHQAAACNYGSTEYGLLNCQDPAFNKEPNAWPFFLSLAFNFSHDPEAAGAGLAILLSVLTIPLVYLIAKELFGDPVSLWSAGIYALMTQPIEWAPTVEPSGPFTFFLCLCVFFALKAFKNQDDRYLFPLYPLLLFTIQMRPEGLLVIPVVASIGLAYYGGFFWKNRLHWLSFVSCLILLIPYAVHWGLSRHDDWGSHGARFALQYFPHNLNDNLKLFVEPLRFPLVDTFLFFIGYTGLILDRKQRSSFYPLVTWFVVFFGIYLFFYAGSYHYGVDIRYSLPIHVPLAILAAVGVQVLKTRFKAEGMALGLILFCLFPQLPSIANVGEEGWEFRFDHDFIFQNASTLPDNAMIYCQAPSKVLMTGKGCVLLSRLTEPELWVEFQKEGRPLYLYYDSWCQVDNKAECDALMRTVKLRVVARDKRQDRLLVLYRILGVKKIHGR